MEKQHVVIGVVILMVAATVGLSGCTGTGKGTLIIQMTDAPANETISHCNVTVSQVEVHMTAGGDNNSTTGWLVITNQSKTFDLISLKNVTEFFASTNLSVGLYTQIRLQVAACTVTVNGTTYNATVPSGKIKLNHPWTLKANATTTLTLDFDAEKSIHQQGNGDWKLQPVIGIIVE
jgi:hypothetical protein